MSRNSYNEDGNTQQCRLVEENLLIDYKSASSFNTLTQQSHFYEIYPYVTPQIIKTTYAKVY